MYLLSLYMLGLALLGRLVIADMNGPGKVTVRTGGAFDGCLDQTMKWVVDGNCGVFTAKTIKSPGSTIVQFTTPAGPCCDDSKGVFMCTSPNSIKNFIPVGTAGEFTALHDNTYTFYSAATPVGMAALNISYNIGTVAVNLFWTAT